MQDAALLFDLDGTLIDSDPLHARVFRSMFAERGREIDGEFYLAEVHGRHNTDIFGKHMPDEDPYALHLAKEAAFREILGARMAPTPGVAALIERAERNGWGLAVVTNAPRLNADAMLAALGLSGRFDAVVIGEECAAGKPDPAPYLHALDLLGADPRRSLAFEDSPSGIAAAAGAGLLTVGLRSSLTEAQLAAAGAALTISDFTDPALAPLLDRLEGALT